MHNKAHALADWLTSLGPHIQGVKPCLLHIGQETFPSALYTQHNTPPAGSRNPRPYTQTWFYCLGESPACYRKSDRHTFTAPAGTPEGAHEWYVASSWNNPPRSTYPMGAFFQLSTWEANDPIDKYEEKPYKRVGFEVEWL